MNLESLAKRIGTSKDNIEKWIKEHLYRYTLQESKDKEFKKYIQDKLNLISILFLCLYFFELSTFT